MLVSREASANFFPEVLRDIWLVPDLWGLYGLLKNEASQWSMFTKSIIFGLHRHDRRWFSILWGSSSKILDRQNDRGSFSDCRAEVQKS